ncbi:uncharacterized protein DS421_14g459560 [Arachis hypogaea]|nr:uncharacterized protein DS421_14g459560 [Arachis hypogaea]
MYPSRHRSPTSFVLVSSRQLSQNRNPGSVVSRLVSTLPFAPLSSSASRRFYVPRTLGGAPLSSSASQRHVQIMYLFYYCYV